MLAGLRWFAAEFVVVVSGILVALAVQSWYSNRRDRSEENAYLVQLERDLALTERVLQDAILEDSTGAAMHGRLLTALSSPNPLSPDSARLWLGWEAGWYSDPRPLLGTVSTLLETGDIALVRETAIRTQIVAYASLMASDMEELGRSINRMAGASDEERRRMARIGLQRPGSAATSAPTYTPEEVTRFLPAYSAAWPAMAADPDLMAAYQIRLRGLSNRVFYLRRMLESTTDLRGLLASRTH
jgi:hypothetical protein